jgi:ion channel-forming bestrophin family protein
MILPTRVSLVKLLGYVGRPMAMLLAYDMAVAISYVYGGWTFISMPHIPLSIFGGAIGVIVGFRNNSSYQRWWEARTLWGAIVNYSRTLARQALTLIAAPTESSEAEHAEVKHTQTQIVMHQIAYVHALRAHLRGHQPWSDLEQFLPPNEVELLRSEKNVPMAIQQRIGELLERCFRRGWMDTMRWTAIDGSVTALANAQGGAERIKNTPMPKQYDFFPQVFVAVYCLLLPLGLVANLQLLTPIGSTLVGFIFLALDEIGRDLESPFANREHDVPLTAICRTIEINLKQLIGETTLPEPVKVVDGVLW